MARKRVFFREKDAVIAMERGNYLRSSVDSTVGSNLSLRWPQRDRQYTAESLLVHRLLHHFGAGQWACANASASDGSYRCVLLADQESRRERPPTLPRQFPHAEWEAFVKECEAMATRLADAHQGYGSIEIPVSGTQSEADIGLFYRLISGAQVLAEFGGNVDRKKYVVPTQHHGEPLMIAIPPREIVELSSTVDVGDPSAETLRRDIVQVERIITMVQLSAKRLLMLPADQDWTEVEKGGYIDLPTIRRVVKAQVEVVDEPVAAARPELVPPKNG